MPIEILSMPAIENIQFVDFNDLYVIAVGISMAYIVVESKDKNTSFFSILSKITTTVKRLLLKNDIKEEEEAIIAKIAVHLDSNSLDAETKGSLKNTNRRAQKELNKIKSLEDWFECKLSFHTKTDFLSIISCDSFLYGLFILTVGAFQNKEGVCVDGLIQVMLMTVSLQLLHCLWFERLKLKSWNRYFKPSIPFHGLLLFAAFCIGIYNYDSPILPLKCGWLSVLSVIVCFIGFVMYLLANLFSNFILSVLLLWKYHSLGISSDTAKEHWDDIEAHREELEKADKQLKQSDFSSEMKITEKTNIRGQQEPTGTAELKLPSE